MVAGLPVDASRLLWHGLRVGATVVVEVDAPLGGPRIVRVGSVRLALGRSVAREVLVRGCGDQDPEATQ
jgi:Fe2+ transport system protein FeoA